MNISSATGRSPVAAAPTAMPMKPASLIGVSITRAAPKRPMSPRVAPMIPPQASSMPCAARPPPPATSSPITTTVGSRSIAWWRASLIAWTNVSVRSATALALRRARVVHVDVAHEVGGIGRRARLGVADRGGDGGGDLVVDAAEIARGEPPLGDDTALEEVERIALRAHALGLVLRAVGERVTDVVAEVAVGFALEERRPLAPARAQNRLAGGGVDREEVHAVDDGTRHAVARGAHGEVADARVVLDRRRLTVAVVLEHENHGQRKHGREVQALVEESLVGGAVAEEGHGDAAGAQHLGGERRADRERDAAAH